MRFVKGGRDFVKRVGLPFTLIYIHINFNNLLETGFPTMMPEAREVGLVLAV